MQFPLTFTNAQLADIARAIPDFPNLYAASDDQCDDPILDVFAEYDGFDSCTPQLRAHLESLGFVYTPNDDPKLTSVTIPSREAFAELCKITLAIEEEYESGEDMPTWDRFGLSGDDDVDYNSSYFDPFIHAVDHYLTTNP